MGFKRVEERKFKGGLEVAGGGQGGTPKNYKEEEDDGEGVFFRMQLFVL